MRPVTTHYETDGYVPCGAYSDRHDYTDQDDLVDCPKCQRALAALDPHGKD